MDFITICLLFPSKGWLSVKAGPPGEIRRPLSLAQRPGLDAEAQADGPIAGSTLHMASVRVFLKMGLESISLTLLEDLQWLPLTTGPRQGFLQ